MLFENNRATEKGGAIAYNLYRSEMVNVTFVNNTAPYGPNIASYPVKVVLEGTNSSALELNDVASGQLISDEIKLSVVDFENQITSTNIKGFVSIEPIELDTDSDGQSSEGLVNGVATFRSLILSAKPGSKQVQFKVKTNAIDTSIMLKQFGKTKSFICIGTSSIQDPFLVNFRYCKPGEIDVGSR